MSAFPANVIMRVCGWCESLHPENLSIAWFPDRLYFCSDLCLQEHSDAA